MQFYIVDVFAEKKYEGNQLAVFLLEKPLSKQDKQSMAREFNFSEATFLNPIKQINGGYEVDIFTPDGQVPFAGHPTLGTAFIISHIIEKQKNPQILLNLGVGPIPVIFNPQNNNECWMQQNQPQFNQVYEAKQFAAILQLADSDINQDYPVQSVSTGMPAIIVPVHSQASLNKCAINAAKFQAFIDQAEKANLLIFSPHARKKENDLTVRVFVDDTGFYEDPATGSANGNLAAYLLKYNVMNTRKLNLRIEQGYDMGRPSLIKIKAEMQANQFDIRVGGQVFLIAEGQWQ